MAANEANTQLWSKIIARLKPGTRTLLMGFVDPANPPVFSEFVASSLTRPTGALTRTEIASLLLDRGILAQVVASPDILELNDAADVMKRALNVERRFDVTLLQYLTDPVRSWPDDISSDEMMRVLDLIRLSGGVKEHLVMIMRRFLRVHDPKVRSRAVKLITSSHPGFAESVFGDPAPRVRSNLIEAICEGVAAYPAETRQLLRRASADTNHRVSTTALFYLAQKGDAEARRNLERLLDHHDPAFRSAAAWAMGKLNGGEVPGSSPERLHSEPEPAAATDR